MDTTKAEVLNVWEWKIPFETGNLRSMPCTVYFAGGDGGVYNM